MNPDRMLLVGLGMIAALWGGLGVTVGLHKLELWYLRRKCAEGEKRER